MSVVTKGTVTVKVHGLLKHKQLQGNWGVVYDGVEKTRKLPRIELFDQREGKSPVHSIILEHVKFPDKTYRQHEDHFTLSIKKEKHVFQFETIDDKEEWVQSLCHVSPALCQQRAKAMESSDFDDSEGNTDMSENMLYDSCDKVHQFKISINPTKASDANGLKGHYMLNPTQDSLRLLEMGGSKSIHEWPYRQIRKYGRTRNIFRLEVGRRCSTGEGEFVFFTPEGSTLSDLISMYTRQTRTQDSGQGEAGCPAPKVEQHPKEGHDYNGSVTSSSKPSHPPPEPSAGSAPSRASMKESGNSNSSVSQKGASSPNGSRREAPVPAPRSSISSRKDIPSAKDKQTSSSSSDTKIYETASGLTAPLDSQLKHELHNKLHMQLSDQADDLSSLEYAGAEGDPVSDTGDNVSNNDMQEMGLSSKEKKKSDKERKKQEKERKAAEAKTKKQLEREQKEQREREAKEMKKQKRLKKESKNHDKLKGKKSFDLPAPAPDPDINIYDEPELLNVKKPHAVLKDGAYCEADIPKSTKSKPPTVVADEYSMPQKPAKDSWKTHGRPESENIHEEDYEGLKKASLSHPRQDYIPPIPPHPSQSNFGYKEDEEDDTYNRLGDFGRKTSPENIYGMASGKDTMQASRAASVPFVQDENEYDEADNVTAGLHQSQQRVMNDYEEASVPSHGIAIAVEIDEDPDYAAVS